METTLEYRGTSIGTETDILTCYTRHIYMQIHIRGVRDILQKKHDLRMPIIAMTKRQR
jgi:hypothetical protein